MLMVVSFSIDCMDIEGLWESSGRPRTCRVHFEGRFRENCMDTRRSTASLCSFGRRLCNNGLPKAGPHPTAQSRTHVKTGIRSCFRTIRISYGIVV